MDSQELDEYTRDSQELDEHLTPTDVIHLILQYLEEEGDNILKRYRSLLSLSRTNLGLHHSVSALRTETKITERLALPYHKILIHIVQNGIRWMELEDPGIDKSLTSADMAILICHHLQENSKKSLNHFIGYYCHYHGLIQNCTLPPLCWGQSLGVANAFHFLPVAVLFALF